MTDDWIEWHWTPEKPYPETLETNVIVRFQDGCEDGKMNVAFWYAEPNTFNPLNNDESGLGYINHYKLA